MVSKILAYGACDFILDAIVRQGVRAKDKGSKARQLAVEVVMPAVVEDEYSLLSGRVLTALARIAARGQRSCAG